MTPCVLMVSENVMGVPAIVGDATGGKVRRRWRVPIKIGTGQNRDIGAGDPHNFTCAPRLSLCF